MKRLKRLLVIPVILTVLLGQGCTKGPSAEATKLSKRVTLNVWGVVDDVDAYQDILTDFRKEHPNVDVRFRRFRLEEYEGELVNAFAEDRGPDLFMVHNTWVDKYLPKISPAPKTVKSAVQTVTGTIQKEVTYVVTETPTITLRQLKNDFADVVVGNSVRNVNVSTKPDERKIEERVVALPLSVDTLALYYNKDRLNAAGIPTPPEGWDQFQAQVRKLVKQDAQGKIIQAGAGIGTGVNVERAPDILSLLMMQNGAVMADESGFPTFTRTPAALEGEREQPPAYEAITFYTDFANPAKDVYTWNAEQPNSLDAFIQGTSAFFLGYNYQLPLIKARAPKLNLGITKAPQITGNPEVNFANYWQWTVSKKSASTDIAWLLVNFMASKDEAAKYLNKAHRPAARKALLEGKLEDEEVGVFAAQVLTSKSWFRGVDPKGADTAFVELIESSIGADQDTLNNVMKIAQEKVSQTIR